MRNEFNFQWENAVTIRACAYLNNVVEQDHRRIKSRVQPMLGFKKFYNARRVVIGIEFVHKLHKDQFHLSSARYLFPSCSRTYEDEGQSAGVFRADVAGAFPRLIRLPSS